MFLFSVNNGQASTQPTSRKKELGFQVPEDFSADFYCAGTQHILLEATLRYLLETARAFRLFRTTDNFY